ncbi:MAG: N-acetyltransferase [Hyphomicrobiales bacterium]|nr:N-acetyltransferase [Hyphomicrobiales bacterium]MBV8443816.1 N-acetyltransferase [Hyphomicrobiales bacterium]
MEIRDATEIDLAEILAIYNEVIANSTAVYAEQPATLEDRRAWLAARRQSGLPVIVAADDRGVLGFASFGDWRGAWAGYRHTIEHTVHVRADARGGGVGTALMAALFERGEAIGKHVMIGAIDAANASSLRFHRRLGFAEVAHFREVGRKFNRWLDLVFRPALSRPPRRGAALRPTAFARIAPALDALFHGPRSGAERSKTTGSPGCLHSPFG